MARPHEPAALLNSEQTTPSRCRYRCAMAFPVPTSTDPSPIAEYTGVAQLVRWAVGAGEILGVGLLVPIAILVVGTPIVLAVRLLIALAERL
jgi:hypothetical protein